MRSITLPFLETGPDYILSPEQWISRETASKLVGGVKLCDVALLINVQCAPPEGARYVLDTGNARDGLLDLPVLGDPTSTRTSSKRVAMEGDVIVSRLRPYLRQVAQVPIGAKAVLGQDRFFCSTEFLVFRRIDGGNSAGLAAWLLSEPIQEMMNQAATGGHHPRISPELLLNSPVDPKYLEREFSESLGRIFIRHLQGLGELRILLRH